MKEHIEGYNVFSNDNRIVYKAFVKLGEKAHFGMLSCSFN
ncbi:hypothetical protein CAEBREN_21310 [Caenorhabditis brenneri]|uniref:Uncharacterized protein n=1 Tax=Caenorhabditis brenneri TaxID=135651 RepID=G0P575_CAEBE|nr:hypothetical protein CAEBREN_21310 [Caenorhabditis brenneri]